MEQLRKDVRRLQKRSHMQQKRRAEGTSLSHFTLQTAMLIALLLQYDFSAAAVWLQTRRRRGTQLPEGLTETEVVQMVKNVFLAADVQELATWTDAESRPLSDSVRKAAADFARGHRLAKWVREQNYSRGVAVPTQLLVKEYNQLVRNSAVGPWGATEVSVARSYGRVWASRWRAKFGGRHMRLRLEEPVGLEERRSKAAQKCCFSTFLGTISGPKNGAALCPQFLGQDPRNRLFSKESWELVPKTGTHCGLEIGTQNYQFLGDWHFTWHAPNNDFVAATGEDLLAMVSLLVPNH